jgi:YVTN family beta-propeller protein
MTDQFPQKGSIEEELAQLAKQIPALPTDFADLRRLLALLPSPIPSEPIEQGAGNPALFSVSAAQPSQSSSPLLGPPPGTTPSTSIAGVGVITHGWQAYAQQQGVGATDVLTTAHDVAANGGMLVFPVEFTAPMMLERVSLWNTDTTLARAWNWGLYEQILSTTASKTLTRVAAGMAPDAFTASAASKRAVPYYSVTSTHHGGRTSPREVIFSADSAYAYVSTNTVVTIVRTSDWTTIRTSITGQFGNGMCLSPDGLHLYVMDSTGYPSPSSIVVLSTVDLSLETRITGVYNASRPTISPNGAFIYAGGYYNSLYYLIVMRTSDNTIVSQTNNAWAVSAEIIFSADSSIAYFATNTGYFKKYQTSDHTEVNSIYYAGLALAARTSRMTPDGAFIYVSISGTTIRVIRTSDFTVVASPTVYFVDPGVYNIRFSSDSAYAYLSCNWVGKVIKMQTSDHTVIGTAITVESNPDDLEISPDDNFVYVVNEESDSVNVIRTSDDTVVGRVSTGIDPRSIAISPNGLHIMVLDQYAALPYTVVRPVFAIMVSPGVYWLAIQNYHLSNTLGVGSAATGTMSHNRAQSKTITIPNKVTATVSRTKYIGNQAINPAGTYVYISDYAISGTVDVLRTSDDSIVASVGVGGRPDEIVITPDNAYIYVSCGYTNVVSVIRASDHTLYATVSGSGMTAPNSMAVSPDGTFVYVAGTGDANHSHIWRIRVSDNTIVAEIQVALYAGENPILFSPNGAYAYIVGNTNAEMQVIRTSDNTVIATVALSFKAYSSAITPDGAYVWMGGGYLDVLRTSDNTIVKTITNLPDDFTMIKMSPDGAYCYLLSDSGSSVTVIRTSDYFVVTTIQLNGNPTDFVVSPDGLFVVVAGYYGDAVHVIRTTRTSGAGATDFTVAGVIPTMAYFYPWRISVAPNSQKVYVGGDSNDVYYTMAIGDLTQLDFVAATWTKHTSVYAAVMEGRVFGQTVTF